MKKYLDIDALLDEVVTLPSIPSTLARITELLEDPNTSLAQVGRVISSDPGIAMKTMRLVNSASYGLGTEIVSIDHAVVMLGARVIKNLVLTATALESMRTSSAAFLQHCVACGVALRIMTQDGPLKGKLASPEEAFILGLFHDIGKLLLGEYMPEQQRAVLQLAREKKLPWHVAEQQLIGLDHAALGGRLAEQWKLPKVFVQSIAAHHDLGRCEPAYREVTAGLAAADFLAHSCGYALEPDIPCEAPLETWDLLGLDERSIPQFCEAFFQAAPAIEEFLAFAR